MWNSLKCYARDLHFGRGAGDQTNDREGGKERERERAFPICNPAFPEKEEGKKRSILFSPRHSGPLCKAERERERERALRISFRRRRRRQATKTYKSGQMKRETGREYRTDRRAGRQGCRKGLSPGCSSPRPGDPGLTQLRRLALGAGCGPLSAGIPSQGAKGAENELQSF